MLFKTTEEIRQFLPIGAGNDFDRLRPHIEVAENKYIRPLLGTAMYEELLEFYDTDYPVSPTEVQQLTKKLQLKIQLSLINLAYFVGFDFLNVSVSDAGFQRIESERTRSLYKYQEDNLKRYFSDAGFNNLDDVLLFLETNIDSFGEFKLSGNRTVLKQSFLPGVYVIESIPFNIHNSRLIFLALRPHIAFIEDTAILQSLGTEIYRYIKSEMVKDEPDAKVTTILPYIRKPLIYLSSAQLMEETGAELGEKGLFFESLMPSSTGMGNKKTEPSPELRIIAMVARNRRIGLEYLEILKLHLREFWDNYSDQSPRVFRRDNAGKKTFWA